MATSSKPRKKKPSKESLAKRIERETIRDIKDAKKELAEINDRGIFEVNDIRARVELLDIAIDEKKIVIFEEDVPQAKDIIDVMRKDGNETIEKAHEIKESSESAFDGFLERKNVEEVFSHLFETTNRWAEAVQGYGESVQNGRAEIHRMELKAQGVEGEEADKIIVEAAIRAHQELAEEAAAEIQREEN